MTKIRLKPKKMRVVRYDMHHIALSVSNRERSVAFYVLLGFEPFYRWEAEDGSLSITHLQNGRVILELFAYAASRPAPESIFDTATDLPVIGTKHFGLRVASIEAARRDLAAKGVVEEDQFIKQGRTGPRYFFVMDPDRILVEISEDPRLPRLNLFRLVPKQVEHGGQ